MVISCLLDILLCCIMNQILYESGLIEEVVDEHGRSYIRVKPQNSSSCSNSQIFDSDSPPIDYEHEEFLNDHKARHLSHQRKMDDATLETSFELLGMDWHKTGQMTAAMMCEIAENVYDDQDQDDEPVRVIHLMSDDDEDSRMSIPSVNDESFLKHSLNSITNF
jgi:hypothetical protein